MTNIKDKIERVKVQDLKYYPDNPRKHTKDQISKLSNQIKIVGFNQPIIIDEDNQVLVGNGRLEAADSLNMEELPCIRYEKLSDAQKKQLIIADNKLNDISEWDNNTLGDWLNDLNEAGLESYFNPEEMTEIWDTSAEEQVYGASDDDFEPPKDAKYDVNVGDVYQLGEHRLICGDSTKKSHVAALMGETNADMVFTDPPYNVNIGGPGSQNDSRTRALLNKKYKNDLTVRPHKFKNRTIKNDSMSRVDFIEFTKGYIQQILNFSNGPYYIFMSCKEWGTIMNVFEELGGYWSSTIIWNKNQFVLSRKDYHPKFEPILYGWKAGAKIIHLDERNQSDVWDYDKPNKSELHPTMKPIAICERAINNSSKVGDVILDLFGGSGSTLIACEQLKRKCYMMELDPYYCSVIIERWEKLTGMEHIKLNG